MSHFSFSQNPVIPSKKPKLIIGIVVSEMRYDYLERYWEKFGDGGFRRLVNNGVVCKNAHHDYLIAESSAGFATIATGAYPANHGLVADYWYDRLRGEIQSSIRDENANTLVGEYESGKYSPVHLKYSTLSDELRVANKFESKVISVSMDPRAAVISGGHAANASYWFDDISGKWISSSYYLDSMVNWVNVFNSKGFSDLYLKNTWNTLYPIKDYTESLEDNNPYEKGLKGQKTFPYDLSLLSTVKKKKTDYSLLRATPFGNSFTKDFAISAIVEEKLGKDDVTDWLSLNFSAGSYLGDSYNSWSIEMEDMYLRLDKDLEHFLNFVDKEIGMKNVLIYFTAENAASHDPAYLMNRRIPSGYFNYNSAVTLLRSYLNVIYGQGDWVKFYYSKQIYLNRTLIDDSKLSLSEFQERAARFILQFEGVSNVLTSSDLIRNNYTKGEFEKMQKTYNQKRSGDIILQLNPGWVETGAEREHSSSYNFDTHVPLIFYGWKTGRREISRNISVTDIMPTIAYFLNISRPQFVQGTIINELAE